MLKKRCMHLFYYQSCMRSIYFFLLLIFYFSYCLFKKNGGGGENRTRVLKSPQGGFIFNQNPAPPLYLNSRLGIRKVTFFKKSFIQQLFCSNPLVHYLLKFIMFVTSIFRFRFICIISMPTI